MLYTLTTLLILVVSAIGVDSSSDHAVSFRWPVDEELEAGSVVGDLRRSLAPFIDPTALENYEYQLLPRPNQDLSSLAIDRQSGLVRTTASRRLDRETVCSHHHRPGAGGASPECIIDVSVGLVRNFQLEQVVSIKIIVIDVNDNAPTFAQPQYDIRLSESTAVGTSVALPTATDSDSASQHGIAGYRLKSRHREFQLLPPSTRHGAGETPYLVLASELKLDSGPYTLVLEAYDGGLPTALTGTTMIVVSVEDANDHAPTFERSSVTVQVREDYPLSDPMFVARASDQDRGANADVSYALNAVSQLTIGNTFKVHRNSGEVFLKHSLDYERDTEYVMVILAIDGGAEPLTGSQTLTVRVVDVNDNRPMVTVNTLQSASSSATSNTGSGGVSVDGSNQGHTVEIAENAEPGSFVAHVSVFDEDSGPGGLVSCRLESGPSSSSFQLIRMVAGQYKLTTSRKLDFETESSLSVSVTCSDNGQPALTTTKNITVKVLDVNDNSPQFVQSLYNVSVDESTMADVTIVQVKAVDADSGLNGEVFYSLGDEDQSVTHLIDVDEKSGVVRLKAPLDHETNKHLVFTVRARDGGTNHLWDSTEVVVTINDVNDEEPVFSKSQYTFQIPENAAEGTEVGHVTAVDRDAYPFNRHVFKIVDAYSAGVGDLFDIDPKSGKIIAKATFDREIQDSYKFTVAAIDEDLPILRSEVPVVVEVTDDNDHEPVFEFPNDDNRTFAISNIVPIGYTIVRVLARDRDTGNNSRLVYRVSGPWTNKENKDAFHINSSTGVLTTAADLSHIDHHSYNLRIVAHDLGVPPRTSGVNLVVVVDSSIAYIDRLLLQPDSPNAGTGDGLTSSWYQTFAVDNLPLIIVVVGVCLGIIVILIVVATLAARVCGGRSTPRQNVYRCRLNEEKAMQKHAESEATLPVTGTLTRVTVGVDKNNGGSKTTAGIGSMTSLQSGKFSSNNSGFKNGGRSTTHTASDEATHPLMQATAEELRLLKALKEDLSDSDCNPTDNELYSAVSTNGFPGDFPCRMSPFDATSFCQVPCSTQTISIPACRYSPIAPVKNGISRRVDMPPYNTITSSTFKAHQHPLTYNGVGTLPITTTVKDAGRERYATITTVNGGCGGGGNGAVIAYQTSGYSKRFPAHSAALGFQCRVVDGGYFTDDRQLSDGDSNSPVSSP